MSGSAGGNRIPRESLKKTTEYYIQKVLKNFSGFTSAKISGSYNITSKSDFGDIDLVVSITSDKDKKDVKKDLVKYLESLPQDLIVPFKSDKHKSKRTLNHGEIITILFPIKDLEGQFVQIDNIISLSEEEGEFKKNILDLPAERQGLILGLVKTPFLEEKPEKVLARMGIKDIEPLKPGQEYEFHVNTSGLTLRKVTLDSNFKTLESTDVWKSTDFNDVKKLLSNYNLEGSFKDLINDIKKLKNPRSKNRVKGWFLKNIRVQAGEKGTPKADQKQQAIDTVAALEEKYNPLVISLIKPFLLENAQPTIALMPGAFKPPHKDHLRRINAAAENADQAIILISPKERAKEGEMPINAEQSIAIWQLYKDKGVLKPNVTFEVVSDFSPVKTAYDIIAANPQNQYIGVYGKEEASRWKNLPNEKYPNVVASDFDIIANLSATDLRTALLNGDDITPFLPEGVTPEEYKKALNIESLTERIRFQPYNFDEDEIQFIDDFADEKMDPIDIDLSGNHFFDRLNDPRNRPEIEPFELEDFFNKLSTQKDKFISFLNKYKEVVAKDKQTDINIPFMKQANKAIAKTVMRKRNFKTSNPVIAIEEGRYDQEGLIISRFTLNQFKENLGQEFEENFEAGLLEDIEYTLELRFYPNDTLGPPFFRVDAASDENALNITINYNPSIFPKTYNALNAEIKDSIRHELEHIGQFNFPKGTKYRKGTPDKGFEYYTLDFEIPAFVQGIYKKAKTQKIPFSQALEDFLDERVDELSPQEEDKLRQIYLGFARENLPAAQIDEIQTLAKVGLEEQQEDKLKPLIIDFTSFLVTDGMKIHPFPKIKFIDNDTKNAEDPLGKTAYYNPQEKSITLFTLKRHPKDILRSYSHELVHHMQNLEGRLKPMTTTNVYEDEELAEIEKEAHELGSLNLRKWEDSKKTNTNG